MERFKACEKEMKTKAYSKEGLTNSLRLDPREKEKVSSANFITSMLEELERQIEGLETEQEMTQSSMKRGKKDSLKLERISQLEQSLERHRWHQDRLERALRKLENGNLSPDSINNIQEDIRYYVESNLDPDFAEDEEIYDELNLDDDEDAFDAELKQDEVPGHSLEDLAVDHVKETTSAPPSASSTTSNSNSHSHNNAGSSGSTKAVNHPPSVPSSAGSVSTSQQPHKNDLTRKTTFPSASSSIPTASTNATSALSGMKPAPPPTRSTNELKYASAAASGSSIPQGLSPLPPPSGQQRQSSAQPSSPVESSPIEAPVVPSIPQQNASTVSVTQPTQSKSSSEKSTESSQSSPTEEATHKSKQKSTQSTSTSSTALSASKSKSENKTSSIVTPIVPVEVPIPNTPDVNLPPGLQDLINSFDAAKKRIGAPPPISTISKLLQSSYMNAPDSFAESQPNYYQPQSPYPTSPAYPKEPLQIFSDPLIFSKMDVDTLFFIFYNKQGTYQQYLAARELKNRSWRFHKHFMTWFQRHEEPKAINNDYEQGTYRYFDFEGVWSLRRKQDFTFEYKFLEDDM